MIKNHLVGLNYEKRADSTTTQRFREDSTEG